jgi:isocitrate dehydrogenase kinase/phosphatase
VFGFAWSYFHVDAPRPRALVAYLASVLPRKRVDELYTAVGYHRHAKTELFRAIHAHLSGSRAARGACFERPPGARGLVMECVALPSMELVLKVIKDRFGAPKRTTRREVMERYSTCSCATASAAWPTRRSSRAWSSGAGTSPRRCSPSWWRRRPPRCGPTATASW